MRMRLMLIASVWVSNSAAGTFSGSYWLVNYQYLGNLDERKWQTTQETFPQVAHQNNILIWYEAG